MTMTLIGAKEKRSVFKVVEGHSCGACGAKESLFVQVAVKSIYVLGIRLVPVSRALSVVCAGCNARYTEDQLPPDLRTNAALAAGIIKKSGGFFTGVLVFHILGHITALSCH